MTLAEAGEWFRSQYKLTPATAMVYLNDWRHENRKTVWYNSRFYRFNMLWEKDGFFIRDIHRCSAPPILKKCAKKQKTVDTRTGRATV